eukprot:TRINITY_DN11939_c1_g1_i2.p1 TRINITY_DN11939_c1_g1~~TRINITY_DN11939_c1_g1_i2.p1  ORF type:complete len:446 (+),score=95.28 TRINITY_DN11939_c1_g1_i2:118-1455(+)
MDSNSNTISSVPAPPHSDSDGTSHHHEQSFVIIGAGIGGLSLALALQKLSLPVVVYERDAAFDSRTQGYSLTMQRDGFMALEALGVAQQVRDASPGVTKGSTAISNKGKVLWVHEREAGEGRFQNFPVARQALRKILHDSLRPDTVVYGKKYLGYKVETSNDGASVVSVLLEDEAAKKDLAPGAVAKTITRRCLALIGCDGMRSKTRNQLVGDGDTLNYLKVQSVRGLALHGNHELIVHRMLEVLDGKARFFIKPFNDTQAMWQITYFDDEERLVQRSKLEEQQRLEKYVAITKQITDGWADPVPSLLSKDNSKLADINAGPVYDREPLDAIAHKDGGRYPVTILGDAVHPMSPFRGQGANQALCDAVSLSNALRDVALPVDRLDSSKIVESFAVFEKEMLKRSRRFVLASRDAVVFMHSDGIFDPKRVAEYDEEYKKRMKEGDI